jgi:hypothetical protein
MQNLAPGLLATPHAWQRDADGVVGEAAVEVAPSSFVPHPLQNFAPSRFSVAHFGHWIDIGYLWLLLAMVS